MNQEVIDYIKDARAHGLNEIEIKKNLLDAGWEAQILEDCFAHLRAEQNKLTSNLDEDIRLPAQTQQPKPQTLPKAFIQASQSQPALNPLINIQTPPSGGGKKPALLISILAILVLAAGAFAFYRYVYANPERVWKKFIGLANEKILTSDFKFSYFDKTQSAEEDLADSPFRNILKNIKLEFSGKAYADTADPQNPQSESEASYSFSSGNTSFSTGFEYKLIGKKFYMNVGNNPFLESIFKTLGKGKKIEWVVLDLDELEKKAGESSSKDAKKFKDVFNPQFMDELKKIWEDARFVKMEKYLGQETLNGKITLHFKNTLNKEAVKTAFSAMADKLLEAVKKAGADVKDDDANSVKVAVSALVDRIEIKEFETWVGLKDFRLYKTKIKTNALSVVSAAKTLTNGPRESSRDAKRLADIRQMASALELYFNDNSRYPDSKEGQPLKLTPTYIGVIPTAPTPADGNCTDYFNTYWYETKNNGQTYELTFCLGESAGGYKAGIAKLTPYGIANVENCPSTPENCYKNGSKGNQTETQSQEKSRDEQIRDTINQINFDAEINIEANYSDYGIKKEVKAPENAFDLIELMDNPSNVF